MSTIRHPIRVVTAELIDTKRLHMRCVKLRLYLTVTILAFLSKAYEQLEEVSNGFF